EVGACLGSGCGWAWSQAGHPNQVVGDRHQVTSQLRLLQPNVAGTSEATHSLHPTKDFFPTRLRMRWLVAYPTWRVVRPSIALHRPLVFCVTCGVTFRARRSATHALVS